MRTPFRGILGRLAILGGAVAVIAGLGLAWASAAIAGVSFAAAAIQNCLVGLLVAAAAVAFVRRRVTRPLARLSDALGAAAEGQAELSSDLAHASADELGTVFRHYSSFMSNLNDIIHSLKAMVDASTEIGENVEAATVKAATLSREVGGSIQKNKKMIASLDAEIEKSRVGVGGVKVRFGEIAGLSEESLRNAERMESLVTEIDDSFSGLLSQGKNNAEKIAGIDRSISRFQTRKSSSTFVIGYNEVPPFCMAKEDGSPPGATNAYLVAVLAKMGVDNFEFKRIQALERIYELLDRNEIDAYTLATRDYSPNPKLRYRVPATPTMTPAPGLLMGKAARADRIASAAELAGLRIVTKSGMPLTPTMLSPGVKVEYLGGSEPLVEGVRLVSQGRADAVYSIIGAELLYMARGLGVQASVKVVPLPDPLMQLFTAFSLSAAERYLAAYDVAHARVEADTPFLRFLEPYIGKGATI